jgi:glucosamine 6-phosphate synthetase-like amidotransferase/phosphosugar isomerase protein
MSLAQPSRYENSSAPPPVVVNNRPSIVFFEPLVMNVYWQLFAYDVAKSNGLNIDKLRTLTVCDLH